MLKKTNANRDKNANVTFPLSYNQKKTDLDTLGHSLNRHQVWK